MALNGPGTFHRTREHEGEDRSQITQNILDESWKKWPNEAAVSVSLNPHNITIHVLMSLV